MSANPRLSIVASLVFLAGLTAALLGVSGVDSPQPAQAKENAKAAADEATGARSNADWPLFRGDSLSSGVARGSLPKKLKRLWKFSVKEGAFDSAPAIVGKAVYIADLDGRVYGLDLETGKQLWRYATNPQSGFIAAPAVRDNRVYIGDIDGVFYCLDAKTGAVLWKKQTGAEIDSGANFYKGNVVVGSQDATLYCFDGKTGGEVWKHTIEDQIRCTPTIVDNRVFVAGCDGKLHIINLDTGRPIASVPIESPTGVTPAVRGDFVYFGTEGGVFFCIQWKKAEVAWTYQSPRSSQAYRSSPAVTAGAVVFGGRDKKLHALNPKDGSEVWTFAARNRIDCSPVIAGNHAYFGAADGRLYGVNLKTGKADWKTEVKGGISGSPAIAHGRLVIASDAGVVYCFGSGS